MGIQKGDAIFRRLKVMEGSATVANDAQSAGRLLDLIRSGKANSRSKLEFESGLSRVTVTQRLRYLLESGLVVEGEATETSGGRPARSVLLNPSFGIALTADVGESAIRVAVVDLSLCLLNEATVELDVASGPTKTLSEILRAGRTLLKGVDRAQRQVLGIGLSLPAPVNHAAGRVVGPSVMRGWDDFDIRGYLQAAFGAPAQVENDVNLMALAEHRHYWPAVNHFLYIKAGTGIGSGILIDGAIYRGARGASGDIGHIQFDEPKAPLCRCGKFGCVEARAAGWAIARDLRADGFAAHNARDVLALVQKREPDAIQRVREAGRVLGEVAADVVSVLNPTKIVVGGTLSRAGEHLLAGMKELIYRRCLPLALDGLGISAGRCDERAGILGAAHLVIDAALAPSALAETIQRFHEARPSAKRRSRRATT
jgi:predicted NBD/HSP70 family sugar kinase